MAEPLSIVMLRRKQSQIRDTIAAYERKLKATQADLAHVNATMLPIALPLAADRQLAEKLAALGIHETERNIANKISRGGFTAVFLIQCLEAIGSQSLRLD